MWTRAELKRQGKIAFKSNYWKTVLMACILSLISGGISFDTTITLTTDQMTALLETMSPRMLSQLLQSALPGWILTIIVSIFLLAPLEVGCRSFFVKNQRSPARCGEIFSGFKGNYWNVTLTMFLRSIYQTLWSLLFFIPGIVKSYSYRLVPYILAENPDMPPNEAITRSRNLMRGHKFSVFVLDLSFLGWSLLGICTLGLGSLLYVQPYIYSTNAELYRVLRGADPAEPQGTQPGGTWDDGEYDEPDAHDPYDYD